MITQIQIKGIQVIAILLLLLFFSSCQSLFMTAYGIKEQKKISKEKMIKLSEKFKNVAEAQCFIDSSFSKFIAQTVDSKEPIDLNVCTTDGSIVHKLKQPIQLMVFNQQGQLIQYHCNCDVGGFPNLKWERLSILKEPLAIENTDYDKTKMNTLFQFLYPLTNKTNVESLFDESDLKSYTIIVFWNKYMWRQSKRLIKYIAQETYQKDVSIVLVNNDNFFL